MRDGSKWDGGNGSCRFDLESLVSLAICIGSAILIAAVVAAMVLGEI